MFENYSRAARVAIMMARREAGRVGAKSIDSEHLLLGAMRADPATIQAVAPQLTIDVVRERATTWHTPAASLPTSVDMPLSDDASAALDRAKSLAGERGSAFVRTEHLLLAFATTGTSHAESILDEAGVRAAGLEEIVSQLDGSQQPDLGSERQLDVAWSKEYWGDLDF